MSTAASELGGRPDVAAGQRVEPGRVLRRLQLCLAALWLIDAMLQGQAFMFSRGFAAMLAATARGSPVAVTGPGGWSAAVIGAHPVAANAAFVAVQLLIALGIAWRPAVKIALAASVAWSLAVWWLGEGLGGLLAPGANPVTGAPGAVVFYAMLAIVLWPAGQRQADLDLAGQHPADRSQTGNHQASQHQASQHQASQYGTGRRPASPRPAAAFAAATAIGAPAARAAWLVLWGGLAVLAALSGSQGPHALPETISAQAAGQPRWLAAADDAAAELAARHATSVTVILTALLIVIALGVFLPLPAARMCLALAFAFALVSWVVGQNLGGVFTGTGTDPNSGPLLALLAAAYWPASPARTPSGSAPVSGAGMPLGRPGRLGRTAPGLLRWVRAAAAAGD